MRHDRGERRDFGSQNFAPVKVGDELDVKIEAVGEKGDGIAKKDGFVLFVPGAKQGEDVKIKVTRVLRKVGFAELVGQSSQQADAEEGQEESKEEYGEETNAGSEEEHSGQDTENFGEESEEN